MNFSTILILGLLLLLLYVALRLMSIRKDVKSLREALSEQGIRNQTAHALNSASERDAMQMLTALTNLLGAVRNEAQARLELADPKIKRMTKTHPDRVAKQDAANTAADVLARTIEAAQEHIDGSVEEV